MPIRHYLTDNAAFEPDAINAMSHALDEACALLGISTGHTHERSVIAARIIDLARGGVIDPAALRDRVLLEARSGDTGK